MVYDELAELPVHIEGVELTRQERATSSGFSRATTVVSLHGNNGDTGTGEDVTYEQNAHDTLQESSLDVPVTGEDTIDGFSQRLSECELFPGADPEQSIARNYRQWAFESAALDLALKQAGTNLADQLDRAYSPVRFVVSTRLEDPPTGDRVFEWLDRDPDLEFKLDPTRNWSADLVDRLAETDAVRVLDLKGLYHGTTVDQPPDPTLYEQIVTGFPEALIEDPALTEETRPVFDEHRDRVAWDHPIQSVDTIQALPWEPTWLNIKPSRFGSVQSLFATLEYCENHRIRMYGGGQFELGVGRDHLHTIASLFYPDAPNDVAPKGYNDPEPREDLRSSPLQTPSNRRGLAWD